ncbi:putative ABC transport system permease protein [Bradyrhizobium elkanii USDA 61]|uniref:Putative ABC transport system permease protein n=1 Tax=Bradyrhizobium elkanii TaxID=29448 RepID=A0A8I1Y270_BRAEL|nr:MULTISPECIES: ABC transporter permease [Bradyrhizobium]MBP1291925.1 putative ABC transport system permease protein [Bradyrhizobium elkanii]MCP1927637.1 putative ABC transport system permease protein [Bradyrhizobium elkanii]MCS3474848.1 putative ABC transport system permease protein [Bradyrhizobium elkanii]MCS3581754.1 putative ABC transport system permease protein [Bradyrhizobium elkanii]MCS3724628.1 putative ABC transport system permease protein [Bradyrhizobium elkanii]
MRRALWILAVLLSHWRRHPMQLATLLIGLISATALWSGVQALNQQARFAYDRAAATFGGSRTAMLVAKDSATFPQTLFVDLRRAGWPVSPILESRVQIDGRSFRLLGVEPVTLPSEVGNAPAVGRGSLQSFVTPPGEMLVALETLRDFGLREGERPQANGTSLPPLRVQAELAPGALIVDIGIAQDILKMPGQVSRLLVGKSKAPHAALESVAGDKLRLVEPSAESELERLTDSFHLNLTAFGLLSFFVGLFIVNSAIGLAFEQRLPMLRTLRACGVSARMLNTVLVIELVSLALVAGLIGLVCGYFIAASLLPDVAASLRGLYGAQIPGQLSLKPVWWFAGIAISILGALAAAAASLAKAIRMPVLATAQPQAWQQAQRRWLIIQSAAALAVFAVAAGLIWFGDSLIAGFAVLAALMLGAALILPMVLQIALGFGQRSARAPVGIWFWADSRQQLSGLSLALMALLLALAVNVGVGTMVESFNRTFLVWLDGRLAADVYISAASDQQAKEIKAWLRDRPEAEAILPGGRADTQLGGAPIEVLGLPDHATYRDNWPLLESAANAWVRLRPGDTCLVSEQLSRRMKLAIGDRIEVPAPGGNWPLEIVGIYADYGNPKGQIAVNFAALTRRFPQTPMTRMGVRVAPDKIAPLVTALQETFGLDDRNIADQARMKMESKRVFNRTFSVTAALNAFTLGVAGIALLTSLLTLANSRLPQLAPLWAIGLTRRRLAALELLKTMAVALITALFALPLGLLVAWCLLAIVNVKAFGWRLPFHVFPLQLLELLAVALAAAFCAAALPVVRLARMQPASLIRIFVNER